MRVPQRRLRAAFRRLGCAIKLARGKGSHWLVSRRTAEGKLSYTFADRREHSPSYLRRACEHLGLKYEDLLAAL